MVAKLIIYLMLTVGGLILFKLGVNANGISIVFRKISINISFISMIGILCYGMSFLIWLNIIKNSEVSFIFPIASGLVAVMTVLGSIFILHEKINIMQWLGIICIIIGVFIVNYYRG